jgi:Cys-tRNA(Pro)/Cys-tRNA(Cys) deacylase
VKTNAVRLLDRLGIRYELREYEVEDEHLDAMTVAARIGLAPEQVFKTLAVRGDRNGIAVAVVPANADLDLKALARLTGDRRIEMLPLKEVQPATGYIRGGVTALGLKHDYPVWVDETVELLDIISVSAGARGTQILLSPEDYLRASRATAAAIAKP